MSEFVRLEVADGIGTIRIERPKMNALNAQVQEELREAAIEATERSEVRAVIVYGGEKVFAAGADIKEMATMSFMDMVARAPRLSDCFTAVARIPKPTAAAVAGYALGAGCELTLCCDFRIAASDATFGQPEVLLGVIPGAGGSQRLTRLVGPAKAKELIFSGRFVPAAEALEIGLADELVEPGTVHDSAARWMSRFVKGAPFALRAAKEAIDRGIEVDLDTGLAIESQQFAACFATKDREIGMSTFVEQGPGKAVFEGR